LIGKQKPILYAVFTRAALHSQSRNDHQRIMDSFLSLFLMSLIGIAGFTSGYMAGCRRRKQEDKRG
jgi:hypothetical protein